MLQRGRGQLEELVVMVGAILFGMWRYRWHAIALAWGVCLAGWAVVYSLPDVFQASTRIYVDTESMIKRVVGDLTLSADISTEINVLTRVMLSQPQLEKTARVTGLDLAAKTAQDHERMLADLSRKIIISREGGDNIFRIRYEHSNRQTAETVVRALLDSFVEDALGERRTDSGVAKEFLETQIGEYERRLNDAETRLATFKRENIGLMPGEAGDYYTRLQKSMEDLAQSRAELNLATERRAEYQKQLQGEEPVFGVAGTSTAGGGVRGGSSGTDGLIAQYEAELETLLLRFTENHPDAVALRKTIDRLKAQQQEERSKTVAQGEVRARPGETLEANPVYQRMRMGLSETEVEIATLRTKVGAQETDVRDLQKLVDTIPEIERQLTALNRDYSVTRDQYETLLKRRESLHITGEVEQSGDQLQFRVIDPPRAPLSPVGPNRPLFLGGTTVGAVGLGLALALLLQQLSPVFVSRRELRSATGLPVLGSVSFAQNPKDRGIAMRRTQIFVAVSAALPVALGLAVLLQQRGHQIFASLLRAIFS